MQRRDVHQRPLEFQGFEPLEANFLYCPNQFLDLCIPHSSRGVVRLVAYLLRRTLGWLDTHGVPIEEDIDVSYAELIAQAGISRGAIRPALDEALAGRFIVCVRSGQANGQGQASQSAVYRLRWDESGDFTTDPQRFHGFYAGEGYRTPIPNAFFDQVVPHESLAVVKVVGAVIRHTVGYQNRFGGRRPHAPLSYSYIQRYTHLNGRANLSRALRHALDVGYIQCVEKGRVHPSRTERKPATYAIKWLTQAPVSANGSKTKPVDRFKKETSHGPKSEPVERFKNRTKEKTLSNNTNKQQAAAVDSEVLRLLREAGFDEAMASELSRKRGVIEIKRQIEWLEQRRPSRNRLGMLRKAIEEDWAKPVSVEQAEKRIRLSENAKRQATQQDHDNAKATESKREHQRRRDAAQIVFDRLSNEERVDVETVAFKQLNSDFFRRRFRTNAEFRLQQCLDVICRRGDTIQNLK